jgi:hypothetical protein
MNVSVSVVCVSFGRFALAQRNMLLTRSLNPSTPHEWIIVDNARQGAYEERSSDAARVIAGVPQFRRGDNDCGSYHHAAGIALGIRQVRTRYALIIDHDFFVVRSDWLRTIVAHAAAKQLSFFGSAWNPRWAYQARYFPTVHFLLIDLTRVPLDQLDFTPQFATDRAWKMFGDARTLLPGYLRRRWECGRFRDTGWRLRARFKDDPHHPAELLVPSFRPPRPWRPLVRAIDRVLPERFSRTPRRPGTFTTESFLEQACPEAFAAGWEEFYWQGRPFAVHLRMVARHPDAARDLALVQQLVDRSTLA